MFRETSWFDDIAEELEEFLVDYWQRVGYSALDALRYESYTADRLENRRVSENLVRRAHIYPVSTGLARDTFDIDFPNPFQFEVFSDASYITFIESPTNNRKDGGEYFRQFSENTMPRILEEESNG